MKNKKILIVGNMYALAKKMSTVVEKVFVAPGNFAMQEFAECVDIRCEKCKELLDFVVENDIDLTIVASGKAIDNNISEIFQAQNRLIFAPTKNSASFCIYESIAKKFLYKLRVAHPRFGVFDKMPLALDYLTKASYPLVVKADMQSIECDRLVCNNFNSAKNFCEDLFYRGEERVVISEYIYGHDFTLYAVTDGYHALPLTTVCNYKFTDKGDGGLLTTGVGSYVPDYKVSAEIEEKLFRNVVMRVLSSLENQGKPYVGILGVDAVLKPDNTYSVIGFKHFLQDFDAQAVLNLIDENLVDLFEACANGCFADEYDDILLNDNVSVSALVKSRMAGNVIPNLDLIESEISFVNPKEGEGYISVKGDNFVLTKSAKTLSRARHILYEDLELIKFEGMKFRTDICG